MEVKKLKFGDPESIALRDKMIADTVIKRLTAELKCPHCKAPVDNCYDYDLERDIFCFNFNCRKNCLNSVERILEGDCFDDCTEGTCFNSKGILYRD